MLPRVKEVLDKLIDEFKNGSVVDKIPYAMFPIPNIPSSKWSLLNHLIMVIHNTSDARGYKQWLDVKRHVIKGKKSFDILVPTFKKVKDEKTNDDKTILKGFCCGCVFRYEDTEGEPLEYLQITLPEFPLIERAKELGVNVSAIPGNEKYYGYYSPDKKVIMLATPEESTFFHELTHLADDKCQGGLKPGQDPIQEIVAELGAQALCRIVGKDGNKHFGKSYQYIENYAKELNITPHTAVVQVISRVDKALQLILKQEVNIVYA